MDVQEDQKAWKNIHGTSAEAYRLYRELNWFTPDDIERMEEENQKREEDAQAEFEEDLEKLPGAFRQLTEALLYMVLCLWAGFKIRTYLLFCLSPVMRHILYAFSIVLGLYYLVNFFKNDLLCEHRQYFCASILQTNLLFHPPAERPPDQNGVSEMDTPRGKQNFPNIKERRDFMPGIHTTAPDRRRRAVEELLELALSMPPRKRETLLAQLRSLPDEASAADGNVSELYAQLSECDRETVGFLINLLVAVDLCRKELGGAQEVR